jgi:class 3 adenylate cyclase
VGVLAIAGAALSRTDEIHIEARVAAHAGPGEVLVSGTVKDLVSGSGLQFTDRPSEELKGIPGTWRFFAAGAASAPG